MRVSKIPLYLKTTYHSSPNARSYQHFVFEITQYNTYTAPPNPSTANKRR